MSRAMIPSQQKVAEKLSILNDRGVGMLTRIYNIKKACSDAKSKPSFLSEKSLESTLKQIVRKFPNVDAKSLQSISGIRTDIIKSLSLYYFTFVDLLDFKDHVCELLTTIDALQIQLDITLNFDLAKGYLDLVSTYVSLMILLSRVDDRKAVLGLFNAAHEQAHQQSDPSFPRLGNMIIEYDPPLKKLSEEFIPHAKVLYSALHSLKDVFPRRNLSADQWRAGKMLSLTASPAQMLNPAQTDTMPCEYLSLETMERWIIFSCLLCHQYLTQPVAMDLWINALQSSWATTLFRDETIFIHSYVQAFFESIKGYGKRIAEVKECFNLAVANAGHMHRERRKFLRSALRDLGLILHDQPGLLGPKALFVLMALCFARDEVTWLLRHNENPPPRTGKAKTADDLTDRQLPELLFQVEVLRALVRKYNQVLQRYYVQYLCGYDAIALSHAIQQLQMCPEDENTILSSICSTITNLNVKQVEEADMFDFRALRLDWYRLQAYTSVAKTPLNLQDNRELAHLLNTVVFHTKMVDFLDEILVETSDLSTFCFFSRLFEDHFKMCLEFPAQNRYIVCFPLICGHFQNCTHELCPEERHHIRERSLSIVNMYLDEMAKEAKNIITTICDEQCSLSDKLLPKNCARMIVEAVNKKKKDKSKKAAPECGKPGTETYRRTREDLTIMDKLHMALTELCFAINYCSAIHVWEYTFAPREYLHQHLESRFARALVGMVMHNQETNEIAKPSELLASVRAYMSILQSVENYVHVDITRVFNHILLQQTQQLDSHGEKTITALYTTWYSEVLLRRVSAGRICYSPCQRVFVSLQADQSLPSAEEFTDVTELRSLAELIGPYGMKTLNETLVWLVTSQVQELKKLVAANRDVLIALRTNFDKPETMKELVKRLQNVDTVLQRMTIVGVILCFRDLCQEALQDVLTERIPFLLSSVDDFQQHMPVNGDSLLESTRLKVVSEMASAAGLNCKVDPVLVNLLKPAQKTENPEEEYLLSCLLMVFVAVSIPRLARDDQSHYVAALEGHANNTHCLANAVNSVFGALFSITGHGDIEDRLKEFLALASSSLLRLGQEQEKEATKHRDSVYLLLDQIVQASPFLSMDLMESCFPYALLRMSYHSVYKGDAAHTS